MTLEQLTENFSRTYGARYAIFLTGLSERTDLLSLSVSDLQDAVRRGRRQDLLAIALARLVSRVFCVADHFREPLPLTEAMIKKFPASGCSYCHHKPCACGEQRPESTPGSPGADQARWTLAKWVRHLDEVYGPRNRSHGMEYVIGRLFREVEELRSIFLRIQRSTVSRQTIVEATALELADIISWVMSAANVLGVNLAQAVNDRYGSGCTTCQRSPCECTHFYRQQIEWECMLQGPTIDIRTSSQLLPRSD